MASKTRKVVNFLKDLDDGLNIVTGHRTPYLGSRILDFFGITDKVKREMASSQTGPYAVLGVREDAHDLVVKAAYRQLQKRFHPDTGLEPNDEKSKAINQAFQEIEKLRGRKL